MAAYPWRLVTIDIDGTLTRVHGWERIAAAAGRRAEYRREHDLIDRGQVDEDTHLTRLFRLAEGMSTDRLDAVLAATPRFSRIAETVAAIHARGARVGLLTHNPGYVIDWYSRRFGFDGGSGGWGSTARAGVVQPPNGVRADKVRGLRVLERRFDVAPGRICHVGDAWPDARIGPLIGGFVAFNAGRANVRAVADAVVRGGPLDRIVPVLDRLPPRRPVKGARPLAEGSNSLSKDNRSGPDGVRRPRRAASPVP